MATLDELVHYCKTENPVGAFMLTGEWGSGKTHLIEKDLTARLEDTHVIARVSLFGLGSIDALHQAVKEAWITACSPVLGRLVKDKERAQNNSKLLNTINSILKGLNPAAGKAADLAVSLNILDVITVEPEIEDIHDLKKKRVVLVFDDLERSKLDLIAVMGAINNYCENQKFNTIIVTNESFLIRSLGHDLLKYQMVKGKTVSRTLFHIPNCESAVSSIIEERHWSSEAYKTYLQDRKERIIELFSSAEFRPESSRSETVKSHNLLALITSLDDFYRIFSHLTKAGVDNPDSWLFSFLAYSLTRKGGVFDNGELRFDCTDEEIQKLYPMFSPEFLFTSIRSWVSYGIWDKELFDRELAEVLR